MKTNTLFHRSAIARFYLVGLIVVLGSLGANSAFAAEPQIPEPTKALHTKLAAKLKPAVREWVTQEAAKVSADPAKSVATVQSDIGLRFSGQGLGSSDIEALAFLVMMEAAKSAQEDLKATMAEVKSVNEKKAALRSKEGKPTKVAANASATTPVTPPPKVNVAQARPVPPTPKKESPAATAPATGKTDTLGEMGETESLRLQLAMDRQTKLLETISNVMKKTSESSSAIIGNLK